MRNLLIHPGSSGKRPLMLGDAVTAALFAGVAVWLAWKVVAAVSLLSAV